MRLISWGTTAALSLLALGLVGCAMAGGRPTKEVRSGIDGSENQYCSWTVDRGPSGKISNVHVNNKQTNKPEESCHVIEIPGPLFIGSAPNNSYQILDVSPGSAEFLIKGTCRYCFLNSWGGMTCVTYPGC